MPDSTHIRSIIEHDFAKLLSGVIERVRDTPTDHRKLIGIAGPPACGKSTLMSDLVVALKSELGATRVVGIPMDGFHLDNVQLDLAETRNRKGAPHTFDVGGLVSLIQRIVRHDGPVYAPEFDRAADLSRNCAIKVDNQHDIVLIEGNYLLLNQPGWQAIADYLTLSLFIDVPDEVLQSRLVQRWLDHGLSPDDSLARAQQNDIPNAGTVNAESMTADIIYRPKPTD